MATNTMSAPTQRPAAPAPTTPRGAATLAACKPGLDGHSGCVGHNEAAALAMPAYVDGGTY